MLRPSAVAAVLGALLIPGEVFSQTPEIQREVEMQLWYLRTLVWLEKTTGLPPHLFVIVVVTVLITLVTGFLLWRVRKSKKSPS